MSWNKIADSYNHFIDRGDPLREHLLDPGTLSLLGDVSGKRVLDAGCGEGYFSRLLSSRGAKMAGIDISPKLVAHARRKSPRLSFSVHDLCDPLPFNKNSFDIVLAHMVLMDFTPIAPTLSEFSRVLAPCGVCVFSILHPLVTAGELGKTFWERVFCRSPYYALSSYAASQTRPWHIQNVGDSKVYHRSLEKYVSAFSSASFSLTTLREPVISDPELTNKNSFYRLSSKVPLFLIGRAVTCSCTSCAQIV